MTIEIEEATKQLLQKLGFTEVEPNNFSMVTEDNIEAHVDFRKENGRRWARKANGEFIKAKDIDTVPILKLFKEERDKLAIKADNLSLGQGMSAEKTNETMKEALKSSGDVVERQNNNVAGDVGQETVLNSQSSIHTSTQDVKSVPAPVTSHLLEVIKNDYEADILEVFGDSGSCKTKLMVHLALEGKRDGKKVRFVDTERNLRKAEIAALGDSYQYLPGITDITNFCKNLPKGVDIIIIDSIGYPVLTDFAKMTANQRGASLLNMITWFGDLKDWAINNNRLVIVTNQPDSDFGKEKDYVNRPFGDKARFAAKEIWEMKRLGMNKGITKSAIRTFRSRIKGYGLDVAQIEINDSGTVIRM